MTTEERLDRIERKLAAVKNRNKRLWLGLVLFGAGILITGAVTTGGDEISARKFQLVDEKGNSRAVLAVTEHGPVLYLADEEVNARVALGVTEGGPLLGLYDEQGKVRAMLGVTEGETVLVLYDEKGRKEWSAP